MEKKVFVVTYSIDESVWGDSWTNYTVVGCFYDEQKKQKLSLESTSRKSGKSIKTKLVGEHQTVRFMRQCFNNECRMLHGKPRTHRISFSSSSP